MTLMFLPFLVLFFITAKMVYLYLACIVLIPAIVGPFFEHLFDFSKEVGGTDEFKAILKWMAFGVLAICIYFMMHG